MKPSWDRAQCETCRYAVMPTSGPYADSDSVIECHAHTPAPTLAWPLVMRSDWCGEWVSDLVAQT